MGDDRWQRIETLFHRALDMQPAERDTFLASACAGDLNLRAEVESLLAADAGPQPLLQSAVDDAIGQFRAASDDSTGMTGKRIGPYSIVSLIGKGGMGAVYRAVRDGEFRMEVALKLLKRGTDTDAALSQFRKERQILAGLQHPNIARLLDGGATADGLPYFVMELVDGRPLLEYAAPLSVRARLELFRSVCAAVQYAHQNLIVHRDLKPGNILVTAEGTPKLLDFGIAKLLSSESAGSDMTLTLAGARLMTPDYASPEQLLGEPVTTATDVYSLGIVLYELLTGARPHRVDTSSPAAIERAIRREPPKKPSALNSQLDDDLDNIVLKALQGEPQRRYASVDQFSEDIRRYLEGKPVRARKDTLVYRSRKFLGRNKLAVAVVALIALGLVTGLVAVHREARRAQYRFQQVRKLANTVLFDLNPQIENLPGSTKAREMLVNTSLQYLDSLAAEAGSDPALQLELATAYEKIGDVQGNSRVANLGHPEAALQSYGKAITIAQKLRPSRAALEILASSYAKTGIVQNWGLGRTTQARENLQVAASIADSMPVKTGDPAYQVRAETYGFLGDLDYLDAARAEEPVRRSLEIARQWVAAEPSSESRYFLAVASDRWGLFLEGIGDLTSARDAFLSSLHLLEKLLQEQPDNAAWQREQAVAWERMGMVTGHPQYPNLENPKSAVGWFQRVLASCEQLAAADPNDLRARLDVSEATADVAAVHRDLDPPRAERLYRRSLALSSSYLHSKPQDWEERYWQSFNRVGFASVLLNLGKRTEALAQLQKAIDVLDASLKRDPGNTDTQQLMAVALRNRAALRLSRGNDNEAERDLRRSLELLDPIYQGNPRNLLSLRDLAETYQGFGDLYAKRSAWRQAQIYYQKSLDLWEHWKAIAKSSIYDQQHRAAVARLVAQAAQHNRKNLPRR